MHSLQAPRPPSWSLYSCGLGVPCTCGTAPGCAPAVRAGAVSAAKRLPVSAAVGGIGAVPAPGVRVSGRGCAVALLPSIRPLVVAAVVHGGALSCRVDPPPDGVCLGWASPRNISVKKPPCAHGCALRADLRGANPPSPPHTAHATPPPRPDSRTRPSSALTCWPQMADMARGMARRALTTFEKAGGTCFFIARGYQERAMLSLGAGGSTQRKAWTQWWCQSPPVRKIASCAVESPSGGALPFALKHGAGTTPCRLRRCPAAAGDQESSGGSRGMEHTSKSAPPAGAAGAGAMGQGTKPE